MKRRKPFLHIISLLLEKAKNETPILLDKFYQIFYMGDTDALDSFWDFSSVLIRHDDCIETEFRSFHDTLFEEKYTFHHSGK
jgi:hypothetical protein